MIAGTLLAAAGSWIPSAWRDEAATSWVTSFPAAEIVGFAGHTDAVYLFYYLLMRPLVLLFGPDSAVLRLPSALAVGVATGALHATGRLLGGPKLATAAAAAFLLIPRTMLMGIEARPYALAAAAVALAAWALVRQIESPSRLGWWLAGAASVTAVAFHLFAALVIAGLFFGTLLAAPRRWVALTVTGAVSGTVCVPFAWGALRQSGQVGWIADTKVNVAQQYFIEAFFPYRTVVRFLQPWEANAKLIGIALAATVLALALVGFASRRMDSKVLAFTLPGLLLTPLALATYSALVTPMFVPRYLAPAVPLLALLLAECWRAAPRVPARLLAGVALAGALALYVSHRDPRGKFVVDDYKSIAHGVAQVSAPGDGLLLDPAPGDPIESGRNALAAYPSAFSPLRDLANTAPRTLTRAWPDDPPLITLKRDGMPSRIVLVTTPQATASYREQLEAAGYRRTESLPGPTHAVELWVR